VLNSHSQCQFAVVGAGPYGLAVGAHLRARGLDVRIFGKPMDFWASQMPKGMLLRSPRTGSHISDPTSAFSLENYETARSYRIPKSMPLEMFVDYGRWFQSQALPDLDQRRVEEIDQAADGFTLTLDDGEQLEARNVVVATGIGSFPNYPVAFASLPKELASHTSDRANADLGRFSGKRVAVIGGGQSALESTALLLENGAEVDVLVRQPIIHWLKNSAWLETMMDLPINPFRVPGKIGPLGINWLVENPRLFTAFPRSVQDRMAARAIRSAGSSWLRPRTTRAAFKPGTHVVSASARGDKVHLQLNDGKESTVDHVLLGTGYRVSVARMNFLAADLSQAIHTVKGYPVLNRGFESSIRGLYFVGASGAYSFGPLCRFVAGTPYTAPTIATFAAKQAKKQSRRSLTVVEPQRA
jgi:FAD-dependent urate hydroxylase